MPIVGERDPNFKFIDFVPTVLDVRRAIEAYGKEISLTKLQVALVPLAAAQHLKYVNWQKMKAVVEGMYQAGMLRRRRTPHGFFRYEINPDYVW